MRNLSRRRFLQRTSVIAAGAALASRAGVASPLHGSPAPDLAHDPLRPQYHLLPAANWMNDPNGPVYWQGQYHMFYQYNPNGAIWGDMHWGHAVSKDMVHWRHLPVALAPTPGGPDADGCFTGSAVIDHGRVAMIYTAVRSVPPAEATLRDGQHNFRETQCLATPTGPDLLHWTKLPAPIIAAPPPNLDITGFRDPCPWHDGDWWYLNVGSGIRKQGGMILLYRSRDLRNWEYLHPLASGKGNGRVSDNSVDTGDMWECPDFFPLGKKHVLIYSTEGKVYWQSGTLDRTSMLFHMEKQGLLDYGSFYAPKTQLDAVGNRILWGWIPETRPLVEYKSAGWAGMMSMPRVLSLDESGELTVRFASQVDRLRRNASRNPDSPISGCCGEFVCELSRSNEAWQLHLTGDQSEPPSDWMVMAYDPDSSSALKIDGHVVPLDIAAHAPVSCRFLIDGSVIELLVNDRIACTKRFYHASKTAPSARLRFVGNAKDIIHFSVAEMSPISSDRLTT
jgi:beta-fructofuranosidase